MTAFDPQAWDAFVRAHPDATFFHLAAWREVMQDVFGHKAHYLSLEEHGETTAVLPLVEIRSRLFGHVLISNAFCVGGGPLARDEASRLAILEQAEALGRRLGVDYVELRDAQDGPGWVRRDDLYAGFERPLLPDEDATLKQMPRRQRAVLRKAMERGLTAKFERTLDNFYPLYALGMRNHGTPAMPRRYFERLLEAFGKECEVLTVSHEGKPVSSVVNYYFRDRVMPYYMGSGLQARELGSNDFMYWTLMRETAARGYRVFDYGRSKVGTGPYSFKRNWGFEPRPIAHQYRLLGRETMPNLNPTNPRYALMIKTWRRLPLPVANAISPFLSRSLG